MWRALRPPLPSEEQMNWGEIIDSFNRPVVMLSTATTGVDDDSKIIAVAIDDKVIYHSVPQDELLPSLEYHGIDSERLLRYGALNDETFRDQVTAELAGKVVMTYNPAFQIKYLAPYAEIDGRCFDLPLLYRGAASHIGIKEQASVEEYCWQLMSLAKSGRRGFKTFCEQLQVTCDDQTLLPLERAVRQLSSIQGLFREIPANILEE